MKILFCIFFLATYALAETITPDEVKLFRQLCALADEGKYSSKTVQGKAEASGDVRLFIKGKAQVNATLTQSNWSGVQRVLQKYQTQENHDYRECVKAVLPYFKPNPSVICKDNEIKVGNQCVRCKKGEIKVGNQCKVKLLKCKDNEIKVGNQCVRCKKGEIKVGNQCKVKLLKCKDNEIKVGNQCKVKPALGCTSEIQEIKRLMSGNRNFDASRLKVKAMASDKCTDEQQEYIDRYLQIH